MKKNAEMMLHFAANTAAVMTADAVQKTLQHPLHPVRLVHITMKKMYAISIFMKKSSLIISCNTAIF